MNLCTQRLQLRKLMLEDVGDIYAYSKEKMWDQMQDGNHMNFGGDTGNSKGTIYR